jgi:4-amino-4-deoxy-L-arabinose transferase-like glycosyltransferase
MSIEISRNQSSQQAHLSGFVEPVVKTQNLIAVLMILAFAILNISSVLRGYSLTTDEDKHILYGERVASGDSTRIDDSKMPITALNALPEKLAVTLPNGKIRQVLSRVYVARTVTIFFSCLLAFLVFYWARSLYGFIPALFSLTLYVLDPNIIAHSQLVTTDLYVTAAITFSFFALWKFANQRSLSNGLICLFALGISQLAKYTAIVLYPLFLLTLLMYDAPVWIKTLAEKGSIKTLLLKYAKYIGVALLASVLIINLGFLFNHTFMNFGEYNFKSDVLIKLQANLPILNRFPIPVPYPYLQGLDWMRNTEQTGNLSGNVYLLGKTSPLKGFPGYYIIASLLKVPIATQIILILAVVMYIVHRERRISLLTNEIFLFMPILFFTIYFNFFFNTQIGIRYYLPVFPALYVFAGSLFVGWREFSRFYKISSLALIAYLLVSVLSYYPYYLSYFNEIVWDRKQAYKYLADSNLDWGQGKNELDRYLLQHPDAIYKPGKARSGNIVVRVNDLVGVTVDPNQYAWLRNNFEPSDSIAYAYLVYKISPEEINKLCTTTSYCTK